MTLVRADYLDGRSTRVRLVSLALEGDDLTIVGDDINLRVPFAEVTVDERLGRVSRRLRLRGGAFCEVRDLDTLDALLAATSHRDGWIDGLQRHWRFIAAACVACIVLAIAAYNWGLPWAAAEVARRLPAAVGEALSVQTLKILDNGLLNPSKIADERRKALTAQFRRLRLPEGGTPGSEILFRESSHFDANAFTLPDGTIILLDGLITALGDDRQILAVVAHELGHAHGHHGMQLLLQSSAVGAFLAFYVGDISQLVALAPAAAVEARYSQDLERQADDYGAALLRRNSLSPALLADALESLAKSLPRSSGGGYLSSHPSTDERIRRVRQLGTPVPPK